MNRLICALLMLGSLILSSCAQNKNISDMNKESNNAAVIYFTNTGTTEAVAKKSPK